MAAAVDPATWKELEARARATEVGARLAADDAERAAGRGLPHRASALRLFGARGEGEVRVTLYRDSAAWCPYCQKLWIMLEEKQVPYRTRLINMRSYGEKPPDFLKKVPRGLLPALELDGHMYTESLQIMAMIDRVFSEAEGHRRMLPPEGTREWDRVQRLLRLERGLFSAWCGYVFHDDPEGADHFSGALAQVEAELGETPGPWFLNTDGPSFVDLQYVSHVERMAASVPYWKGVVIRGSGRYPRIDAWFTAFERRPSYHASRSDWYTHIKDIPPQYGPGVAAPGAADIARALDGGDAAWRLPLPSLAASVAPSDVLQPGWEAFEAGAPAEAAWRLVGNGEAVARFMARAAGGGTGRWASGRPDRAALADPAAPPAQALLPHCDRALRLAVEILLDGASPGEAHREKARALALGADGRTGELRRCCEYLRDRVGVPRDMTYPAARALRGALNFLADALAVTGVLPGA